MNFDGNFKLIGHADISEIKPLVLQLTPQQWVMNQARQKRYTVHKDTQSVGIVYDEDFRHVNPTKQPFFDMFAGAMMPILKQLAAYYDNLPISKELLDQHGQGYCIRANLVRMNPGGEIDPHQDNNFSLAHSHRVHIPIITNEQVEFTVGGETISMLEGEIIEINNKREHSVKNNSSDGRVHLIFDWVIAGEPCCCSSTTHPGVLCSPEACEETTRLQESCDCF